MFQNAIFGYNECVFVGVYIRHKYANIKMHANVHFTLFILNELLLSPYMSAGWSMT